MAVASVPLMSTTVPTVSADTKSELQQYMYNNYNITVPILTTVDEQNQCTNDRDCDSGECYAFGDLGFRRCVESKFSTGICIWKENRTIITCIYSELKLQSSA